MLRYVSSDGKTYEERMVQAITEIPLYSSEWTNFNPSDPGITILETLTGFETLQQDSMDDIPFQAKANLLKMTGFEIRKGRSARLLLAAKNIGADRVIPANHKFRIGDLVFETGRSILLKDHQIHGIFAKKNDEEAAWQDLSFLMSPETRVPALIFGEEPAEGDALYFISKSLPEPGSETAFFFTLQERYNRNPFEGGMENVFALLRYECYTVNGWEPMRVRDSTCAFLMSGEVRMWMPDSPQAVFIDGPVWGHCIRVVLERADYDIRPKLTSVETFLFEVWQKNTISECHSLGKATEAELVSEMSDSAYVDVYCRESKGGSYRKYEYNPGSDVQGRFYDRIKTGKGRSLIRFNKEGNGFGPERGRDCVRVVIYSEQVMRRYALGKVMGYDDQEIELPFNHIVAASFCIIARRQEKDGSYIFDFVRPERSEDGNLYYHLMENDGKLVIEDAGDFVGADLFLAAVSLTNGSEGNIRAGNTLTCDGDRSGTVFYNPGPGTGGAYREKLEDVRQRFIKDMDTPYTAVTERDYEQLVLTTPGICVHKAKAQMDSMRNLVQIAVMPGTDDATPSLSPIYKKIIEKRLEDRRLLTTRVELIPPIYVPVNVTGTVYVKLHYENCEEEINRAITEKIDYLNSDRNFGDILRFDEVFHAVELLDCVEYVYELSLRPQSVAYARMAEADIKPASNCLLIPGQIRVETVTFED